MERREGPRGQGRLSGGRSSDRTGAEAPRNLLGSGEHFDGPSPALRAPTGFEDHAISVLRPSAERVYVASLAGGPVCRVTEGSGRALFAIFWAELLVTISAATATACLASAFPWSPEAMRATDDGGCAAARAPAVAPDPCAPPFAPPIAPPPADTPCCCAPPPPPPPSAAPSGPFRPDTSARVRRSAASLSRTFEMTFSRTTSASAAFCTASLCRSSSVMLACVTASPASPTAACTSPCRAAARAAPEECWFTARAPATSLAASCTTCGEPKQEKARMKRMRTRALSTPG